MAGVVCLAILETGERKKLVLPTGAHSELLAALAPFVPVNENTLVSTLNTLTALHLGWMVNSVTSVSSHA